MTCYKTQWGFTWSTSPPSLPPRSAVSLAQRGEQTQRKPVWWETASGGGRETLRRSSGSHQCQFRSSRMFSGSRRFSAEVHSSFWLVSSGGRQTLIIATINADENIVWVITCGLQTDPQAEVRFPKILAGWIGRLSFKSLHASVMGGLQTVMRIPNKIIWLKLKL